MNRRFSDMGSAPVIVMFAVLCLAILSLISHTAAQNEMTLAQAEAELVTGYYGAEVEAERMLADILARKNPPRTAEFACEISDKKELYVKAALKDGAYEIISWSMRDVTEWQPDRGLPVWPGNQ